MIVFNRAGKPFRRVGIFRPVGHVANVRERLRVLHDVAAQFSAGPAPAAADGRRRFEARLVLPSS